MEVTPHNPPGLWGKGRVGVGSKVGLEFRIGEVLRIDAMVDS